LVLPPRNFIFLAFNLLRKKKYWEQVGNKWEQLKTTILAGNCRNEIHRKIKSAYGELVSDIRRTHGNLKMFLSIRDVYLNGELVPIFNLLPFSTCSA